MFQVVTPNASEDEINVCWNASGLQLQLVYGYKYVNVELNSYGFASQNADDHLLSPDIYLLYFYFMFYFS